MIDHIALDAGQAADAIARHAFVARHLIAAPAGVDESDAALRVMRQHVMFDISRIEPLLGDAVAVKEHAVAVSEREITFRLCRRRFVYKARRIKASRERRDVQADE